MRPLPALVLVLPALLAAAEPAAKPVEPTADELAGLMVLNGHRGDRGRNDNKMNDAIRHKAVSASIQYLGLKGGTAAPPLVFNPALESAARALLAAGAKPESGKPFDHTAAFKAAGYTPDKDAVVLIGLDQPSLFLAYASGFTQPVGELKKTNGTQILYAGPDALKATWREAGVAVANTGGRWSMVVVLGAGSAKRYVGGVCYLDANHNGRCDPGEGKPGVTVSVGSTAMTTGAGGAWWLALASDAEAKVEFAGAGFKATRPLAKGTANTAVDWRMPNPTDIKAAEKLIADAEKAAKGDAEAARKPQAALLIATRMSALDDDKQKKVDELVAPVKDDFESTLRKALAALAEDQATYRKQVADMQKPWKGALAAWFRELDGVYRTRSDGNAALAAPAEQQAKRAAALLKPLAKEIAEATDPAFLEQLETLQEALQAAVPPEPAPAAKKR